MEDEGEDDFRTLGKNENLLKKLYDGIADVREIDAIAVEDNAKVEISPKNDSQIEQVDTEGRRRKRTRQWRA